MTNQIREDKKEVVLSVVETTGHAVETISNNKKELLLSAGHGCKEVVLSAGKAILESMKDRNTKRTLGLIGVALLVSAYLKPLE